MKPDPLQPVPATTASLPSEQPSNDSSKPVDAFTPGLSEEQRAMADRISRQPTPSNRSPIPSTLSSTRMRSVGYRMIAKLGEGAFGSVYLAEEPNTSKQVAIKFFDQAGDRRHQLFSDVRRLAELDNARGIVHLIDVEPDAEPPYFVMEYAEGGSLADRIQAAKESGKSGLPVSEALPLFQQAVEALAYVHAKGIRHCDLKPANILLDRLGRPLLADFGQANLSSGATRALGTFFYMAPEQATELPQIPDPRWDVYGMGAVLYCLVTGEPPHRSPAFSQQLESVRANLPECLRRYREYVRQAPIPTAHRKVPGVDGPLARLIERCLDPDPSRRPRDAGEILTLLKARQEARQTRPLLIFGAIAPLLLMVLTWAIGYPAINSIVSQSHDNLTQDVTNAQCVCAQLAARLLEERMNDRIEGIRELSRSPKVLEAVRPVFKATQGKSDAEGGPARRLTAEQSQILKATLTHCFEESRKRRREFSSGMALVNAEGFILARVDNNGIFQTLGEDDPDEVSSVYDQPKYWRDWFNGSGKYLTPDVKYMPPVRKPHISQPYRSQVSRIGALIDISCPLRDGTGIVGLLVGGLRLQTLFEFLSDIRPGRTNQPTGQFVAVVNESGRFLSHPHMGNSPEELQKVYFPDGHVTSELTERSGTAHAIDYIDPLDGGHYLAGMAKLHINDLHRPNVSWTVIVQQKRELAWKPVDELRQAIVWRGGILLVVVGCFTAVLWGGLLWWTRNNCN